MFRLPQDYTYKWHGLEQEIQNASVAIPCPSTFQSAISNKFQTLIKKYVFDFKIRVYVLTLIDISKCNIPFLV